MFGLAIRRVAGITLLLAAGCGDDGALVPVASIQSALSSCNVAGDCPVPSPSPIGRCVDIVCNSDHTCGFGPKACAAGCMRLTGDCSLGSGACYLPSCNDTTGVCDFSYPPGN